MDHAAAAALAAHLGEAARAAGILLPNQLNPIMTDLWEACLKAGVNIRSLLPK